jgi:hypothetical protein
MSATKKWSTKPPTEAGTFWMLVEGEVVSVSVVYCARTRESGKRLDEGLDAVMIHESKYAIVHGNLGAMMLTSLEAFLQEYPTALWMKSDRPTPAKENKL